MNPRHAAALALMGWYLMVPLLIPCWTITVLSGCSTAYTAAPAPEVQPPNLPPACILFLSQPAPERVYEAKQNMLSTASSDYRMSQTNQIQELEEQRDFAEGVADSLRQDQSAAHEVGQHGIEVAASRAEELEEAKIGQLNKRMTVIQNAQHLAALKNYDAAMAEEALGGVLVISPVTRESLTRDLRAFSPFAFQKRDLFCSYLMGQMSDSEYARRSNSVAPWQHETLLFTNPNP
jgi:hypothetical protein